MVEVNQGHLEGIKKILLSDDFTLVNIAGELNRYNNCLLELSYHDTTNRETNEYLYVLDNNNKSVNYDYIKRYAEKKINDIIPLMLKHYNHIDVGCSELEDYIEENNLC